MAAPCWGVVGIYACWARESLVEATGREMAVQSGIEETMFMVSCRSMPVEVSRTSKLMPSSPPGCS